MPNFNRRAVALCLCLLALLAPGVRAAGQGEAPAAAESIQRLSLPGTDWALDLALPGFVVVADQLVAVSEGGGRWVVAAPADRKTFLLLSVRMSPARGDGGGTEFRDAVLAAAKKSRYTRGGKSRAFEYAGLPLLKHSFDASALLGLPPTMSHALPGPVPRERVSAFLAKDGVWIEIALAGVNIGGKEEKVFYAVLDTVKLADTSAPATSFDFLHKGHPFYMSGEFKLAAEFYRRALELERRGRRLGREAWRGLVEETAVIHSATGDLGAAQEAIEYGLSQDPEYARFHFLLAHLHARRDDLDATIASLRQAYLHGRTLPAHLRLPDPATYPPFKRFHGSEKFRQAVKTMKP